jgi:hypothetical protein
MAPVKTADEWLAQHAHATGPTADSGAFGRFLSQNGGAGRNLSTAGQGGAISTVLGMA